MLKRDELTNPDSCFNRARMDEMVFVLLARDVAAPSTIRQWVKERIARGKNIMTDRQIEEALLCADAMEDSSTAVTAAEALRQAQNIIGGNLAPLLRCWITKTTEGTKYHIGFRNGRVGNVILASRDSWMKALEALSNLVAHKNNQCNICNRPDCEDPNGKH